MRVIVPDVCERGRYTSDRALQLAKERALERPSFSREILDFFSSYLNLPDVDLPVVERTIDILTEILPVERLFGILRLAMENGDPQVRSKSALSLGRRVESIPLLRKLVSDHDPRVRANTIEALWGRRTPDILAVFEESLADPHHRVTANAVYGLYLVDPERYLAQLAGLAAHTQSPRRAAAAWVVGKIGDMRHASILKPLITDPDPNVRRMAFNAIATLRSAHASAA